MLQSAAPKGVRLWAASSKSIPEESTDLSSPASVAKPASNMEFHAAYQAGNSTSGAFVPEVLKADPAQRDAYWLAVIAHGQPA
jgi:hypothetical protein